MNPLKYIPLALIASLSSLHAQDPKLAPADLQFTKSTIEKNHLAAKVTLEVQPDNRNKDLHYKYESYPGREQIQAPDGTTYGRKGSMPWMNSNDWGETGPVTNDQTGNELTTVARIVDLPFIVHHSSDQTQGGFVWKPISQKKDEEPQVFTYEMSREHPNADGFYPQFTFIKYKDDKDGNLLLKTAIVQIKPQDTLFPVEVDYSYMFIMPANSDPSQTGTMK